MRCLIHKRVIRRSLDEATLLPHETELHIEQCESCRLLFDSEREVTEMLQSAGTAGSDSIGTVLRSRIMARVGNPVPAKDSTGVRTQTSLALAAIAIAIFIGAFLFADFTPDPQEAATPLFLTDLDGGQWVEFAEEIEKSATSPYLAEMHSLSEDLGAAANLLVACLGQ